MPLLKTSTRILDRKEPLELVLEIPSFAGGENTIGEDQELKVNEARIIENWDAVSLGGMIRSKGFTSLATNPYIISSAVFTGGGLNDATSGGTYTTTATHTYTVIIDATGTPDTFKWKKDSGSFTTGVSITGSAQTLTDGITITFAATTGHTLNDQWVITVTVYTAAPDLLLHHYEGATVRNYVLISGNLFRINGSALTVTDASAFTSGVLTHGVTAGSRAWMTNSTDNLKYTTTGGSITVPTGVPASARDRIYYHKQRLIAEGGGVTIYGSRAGSGNWHGSANTWTASGDAWSIDLPDLTQGLAPAFPNGDVITAFTKHQAFTLYNFPNIAYKPVQASHGCSAPYSIAQGVEGLFFLSQYPTLGVYLWDNGGNFINLTINEDWITDVKLTTRIFGYYRENEYGILYASTANGQSYPDTWRIYDTKFGIWKSRPVNSSLSDNFGYPAVFEKPSNLLTFASSRASIVYDMEDASNSDNTYTTKAKYKTKDFTSKDFRTIDGGGFPIDEVRLKLLKMTVSYYGTTGQLSLAWTSDRGLHTGSQLIDLDSRVGDKLNTTFIMNSSYIIEASTSDKTVTKSFQNSAVGRRFSFEILNTATGERPKIKKIKIFALALEEQ